MARDRDRYSGVKTDGNLPKRNNEQVQGIDQAYPLRVKHMTYDLYPFRQEFFL